MRVVIVGLLALLVALTGCMATPAVTRTHQITLEAGLNHAKGANGLVRVLASELGRRDQRAIAAFTDTYLNRIGAAEQIEGSVAASAARRLIQLRDELLAKADAFQQAVVDTAAENDKELATMLRAHGLVQGYLLSGVNRAEVQPYVDALQAKLKDGLSDAVDGGDLDKLLEALK